LRFDRVITPEIATWLTTKRAIDLQTMILTLGLSDTA
jgi:hypothetical protein